MKLEVIWLGPCQPFTTAQISVQAGNAFFTSDVMDRKAREELAKHLREIADELEGCWK